ncbi:MAG: hypothetical protein RQ824_03370 [bacterium]|nr:hypothetical protein [bacterium]
MADSQGKRQAPSYGNRLGFWFFHLLIKTAGPIPAYILLALILPYYLLIRISAGKSALPYLRHRFPEYGKVRLFFATYLHFYRFGQTLIDQACMGILHKDKIRINFPDKEILTRLARNKKGMVLLTTHAGNWMTALTAMDKIGVRVNLLLNLDNGEGGHLKNIFNERDDFRLIPPDGFMGGLVEATNALNSGEVVSIMGDRSEGARSVLIDFLGEKASFPITPYHLALATGSDLVVLLTARTGMLSFSIDISSISDGEDISDSSRDETIKNMAEKYVYLLEKHLKFHPYMWYNFFDTWNEIEEKSKLARTDINSK